MRKSRWVSCGIGLALMLAALAAGPSELQGAVPFLRGDTDESGSLAVTDAIRILEFLFAGKSDAVHCQDAADVDDSGQVDIADALFLLHTLFRGSAAPPAPFPACGEDPTADTLDCESFSGCVPRFQFFGLDFVGDGAFFVIDRSVSFVDRGQLARAKQELVQALTAFPDGMQFGVIFTDGGVFEFPSTGNPARLNANLRATAIAWVESVAPGSGSCDEPALQAALGFAGRSTARVRDVFYVSGRGETCSGTAEPVYLKETLKSVTDANQGRAHLHTIGLGPLTKLNEQYMRDLAEQNGGTFHKVP